MIPRSIVEYLKHHGVAFERLVHPEAITGAELAAAVHVSGHRVAKSVLVESAGKVWMAVLPASEQVDPLLLGEALGHGPVRLLDEWELARLFPDCELGAEPPFGHEYGLPVIVDTGLTHTGVIVVRAGSHRDALMMRFEDYTRLELPRIASFALPPQALRVATAELRA